MCRSRPKHAVLRHSDTLAGRLCSEERVLQGWSSTVLSQLSALPGAWSSVPSLNSFLAEGLKGLALRAGQNCVKRLLYIRGCTRVGQMGPSRSLFPLSHFHSHCLLQICTIHVTRPTWHLQDTVIFPHSLLCLHLSPPSLCLGTAWLSCSTPSSVLKFAVGVGSLWPCVGVYEPAPLRRSLGGAEK